MGGKAIPSNNKQKSTGGTTTDSTTGRLTQSAGFTTNTTDTGGSLPVNFDQLKATEVNVVKDYRWTLSDVKDRDDIPYIRLTEHRYNESMLKRQALFYAKGITTAAGDAATTVGNIATGNADSGSVRAILDVYDEIFPDNPTGFSYVLPYFSKNQFELTTPQWQQVDGIGEAIQGGMTGLGGTLDKLKLPGGDLLKGAAAVTEAVGAAAELGLKALYPVVGIVDRPRIFTNHAERSVTVSFPLYNTVTAGEWAKNRNFYYTFASQNLFAKRNFITGLPPVFYRVFVPGQYFSFASCVTQINIENLGNITKENYGGGTSEYIIPDAYQVTITLTEMLMPSLNQYQALQNGDARNRVRVTGGTSIGSGTTSESVVGTITKAVDAGKTLINTVKDVLK
jgi:hypothetical protein